MKRLWVVLLLTLSSAILAQDMSLHVISRPDAQALVPVIGPLLPDGATVNAYQGKLIIRTTNQNFAELQTVLGEMNSQPKQVTVYLRRRSNTQREYSGAGIDTLGRQAQTNVRIQVEQRRRNLDEQQDYRVQTLSGYPASISQGTLLALTDQHNGTNLHTLKRGIQVIPQVSRDGSVTLQIQQRHDQPGGPGIADTQHSATTLRLQPGQWRQLGAINTVSQTRNQDIGRHQTARQTVTLPIEVMVELAP